jgi:hypothetical protein
MNIRNFGVLEISFVVIVALIASGAGYLLFLQIQGVPESATRPDSNEQIFEGIYMCLPHTDGTKPKECRPGIEVANDYYALDMGPLIEAGVLPQLSTGARILVGGEIVAVETLSSDEWQKYPIKGLMRVKELSKR